MPTTEKLRNKLMSKLTELFQLDQPDLDFGFYRIMQAKAEQVKSFIDKDLPQITGLTQNQNLRDHHVDPIFTDAAIVQ
jgi:hypothetical protein